MKEMYELAVLAKPLLPEDIKAKVVAPIEKTVESLKGVLESKLPDMWGKKHLAYNIKKHEEGYYCFFSLQLDPSKLDELKEELNLMQDILRYLIISEDNL